MSESTARSSACPHSGGEERDPAAGRGLGAGEGAVCAASARSPGPSRSLSAHGCEVKASTSKRRLKTCTCGPEAARSLGSVSYLGGVSEVSMEASEKRLGSISEAARKCLGSASEVSRLLPYLVQILEATEVDEPKRGKEQQARIVELRDGRLRNDKLRQQVGRSRLDGGNAQVIGERVVFCPLRVGRIAARRHDHASLSVSKRSRPPQEAARHLLLLSLEQEKVAGAAQYQWCRANHGGRGDCARQHG